MSVSLNNLSGIPQQLQQIAKMAYGSGSIQKTSGGAGYIGQIGGHVVKFATHSGERPFGGIEVTRDVQDSCNALRRTLGDLARKALGESREPIPSAQLKKIYKSLGLTNRGEIGANLVGKKSLLSRKVVAKALNAIQREVNKHGGNIRVWRKAEMATRLDPHALTEQKTDFARYLPLQKVKEALDNLRSVRTPLDMKLEKVLAGTVKDDRFNLTADFADFAGKVMTALPEGMRTIETYKNIQASLTVLQKDLDAARAELVSGIREDLRVIATEGGQLGTRPASRVQAARNHVDGVVRRFNEAVQTAFSSVSKDKVFGRVLMAELNGIKAKGDLETSAFKNLTKGYNDSWSSHDAQMDYQTFFNAYLGLDVLRNLGTTNWVGKGG